MTTATMEPKTAEQAAQAAVDQPITQSISKDGNNLLSIKIRKNERGLQIELISLVNWQSFLVDKEEARHLNIGGVRCFRPSGIDIAGIKGIFSTENTWMFNEHPNLTMLLAPNINKGVTFNFPPFPVSDSKIYDWIDKLKRDVKVLYLTYCKPLNIEVIISAQTIEREVHF